MKIAFNPSTVAALTTPPNNKDITFDLRGHNIFARGVKFCGTDTWRPVVDNLTSDSTTSSLSANLGRILKALIDSKSNSGHTHDDRYLRLTGGTMASNALITFADSGSWGTNNGPQGARGGLYWTGQSDYAKLYAEETAGDNLDLVIQFGDDNSNGLSIRNKANTQTSYISAGGVITTGTFKGNLDWSYITNKPSSYTPSAHTHAWNSLTHSSTTANQAILTNGSANGWKLYTLNIARWDNAANNAHSHANKSVLDGITSALVNNWNTAYTFVNTITGTDTDKVINKWDEIVNFLAGITEDNKLNTLLNSKLSVYKLADNTNVGAIKNNGIYYSTTDASSGTLVNSPFNTGFALINMTSYDEGDDLRRSRLAFNAYGEIKVSNDRGLNNTTETWYNVLTSKNSGINGSTIKLNGTSITVYSSSTADGRYVKKSGDTMTGTLNFANGTWNKVGDDSYMGDCNVSGHFGIKAANTTYPGIAFFNNANAHLGNLTAYNGNIKYRTYSLQFLDNGNTSVSASTWMNPFSTYNASAIADGQAICVWGQSSYLSNLASDSGNMSLWLKRVNAKAATLNMVLDGEYYANGNLRLAHVSEIPTSLKNPHALTISLNGTSQGPYDGSAAKSINITPGSIGAAVSNHSHNYAANENYGGFTKSGRLPISGFYQSNASESGGNAPWSGWMHLINCLHSNTGNNYALLIAASFGNNNTFKIRVTNNNVNNTWRDIIHSGNIGNQTVANAYHLRINSANTWSTWYWSGLSGQPSWLWGSNDGTNMYVWNPSNFRVAYASSAGNADTLDGLDSTKFLRQVVVPNNTENDFNTFSNMTLTGRVDPTTGASLKNAPWSGSGPGGGYGVLTYLFNGYDYGTQMAWEYGSNRIYIRNRHWGGSGVGVVWKTSWDKLALTSDIPSSLKNPYALTLKANGTTLAVYDGSSAKEANFTYANVGAAPSSHTHSWTSITDKIVAGNEFNIVNAGFNAGIWFNYRPINNASKTATITGYHFGNGNQGYTSIKASGFIKNGSNSSYVLLGDGGHQTISSLSVNHANSAGNADYIRSNALPTPANNTVKAYKDSLAKFFNDIHPNVGVGANVNVSESIISHWSNDSATYRDSSTYCFIKIGGAYAGATYGQFLLSSYNLSKVGIVGRNNSQWSKIKWLAYEDQIPTDNKQLTNGAGYITSAGSCAYATSAGNADKVDGYHASSLVKFYLSPMASDAPADSAKSWFVNTMPSSSGAIVYNVPGSEKTIIAGKSSGAFGHMLQLNYDDTYLRILRYYNGSWKSTNWEKISAGYADSAGSIAWSNITGKPSSLKNPYSLNVFGVAYDGSAAKTVTTSNFISLLSEGTSTVTDGTMFITSWASDSGFADTNAVNVPYKRKASCLWNYIDSKVSSKYLPLAGGTMNGNARIGHGSGSLYIGNSGNDGWIYTQDIASLKGTDKWAIRESGAAHFGNVYICTKSDYTTYDSSIIECYAGNNLYLNYYSTRGVNLCNGGGTVQIGSYTTGDTGNNKLYVNGSEFINGASNVKDHVFANGFRHRSHNSDDAVLLAGGGYSQGVPVRYWAIYLIYIGNSLSDITYTKCSGNYNFITSKTLESTGAAIFDISFPSGYNKNNTLIFGNGDHCTSSGWRSPVYVTIDSTNFGSVSKIRVLLSNGSNLDTGYANIYFMCMG